MVKREPLECGIIKDREMAEKYNEKTGKQMVRLSKSLFAVLKKWGITGGKVLDVGTGTGLLTIELAKKIPDIEIVGLDLSEAALEVAKTNIQEKELLSNISFKKGDAEDMPFEDNTFDLVISSNTLHLVNNPVNMLDEIRRVLKPGGKFFISDIRRSWLGFFSRHMRASYSPKEVKEMLSKSMMNNWKVKDYFFWMSIIPESELPPAHEGNSLSQKK